MARVLEGVGELRAAAIIRVQTAEHVAFIHALPFRDL
jgi:hypothetical protein